MIPRDFQPLHLGRRFSFLSCTSVCEPTVSKAGPPPRVEAIIMHSPVPAHRFWPDASSATHGFTMSRRSSERFTAVEDVAQTKGFGLLFF
jgi:hypothetical protein